MIKFSKFMFLAIFSLIFTSCVTVKIQSLPEELCSDKRMPSSVKSKCIGQFQSNTLKHFQKRAQDPNAGLLQTKFTSPLGLELKSGLEKPLRDPSQIVSFFSETNSDGTPNRGGVMIQGTPTEIVFGQDEKPAYVIFNDQSVRLLEHHAASDVSEAQTNEIKGQGYNQHPAGFGTPVGFLKGWKEGLGEHTPREVESLLTQFTKDGVTTLEFESGVIVKGTLKKITAGTESNQISTTVLTFAKCDVTLGNRVLFSQKMGDYDMALGFLITDTNARSDDLKIATTNKR